MIIKTRLTWLFLVFIIILSSFAVGVNLDVKENAITEVIGPTQKAEIGLTITNRGSSDSFTIDYFDIAWRVKATPNSFTLGRNQNKTVLLEIFPIGEKKGGIYGVPLQIIPSSDPVDTFVHRLTLNVVDYEDLLDVDLILPEQFDPRKKGLFKVRITNDYNLEFEKVKIKVESDFLNAEEVLDLGKYDQKEVSFSVDFEENTKEGNYPLNIIITQDNREVEKINTTIVVSSYEDVQVITSPETSFLKERYEILRKNEGNVDTHEVFSIIIGNKLFTSTNIKPIEIIKEGEEYRYTWEFDLGPGEEKLVIVETNYRGITITLIVLLIIILVLYNYFRRDLKLHKKIVKLSQEKDGTSKMKVMIIVKNKGLKKLNNVKLMDTMTHLAEAPEDFGTLTPRTVDRTKTGIRAVWLIGTLARGEERIISYNVRMRVHIVGKVFIHKAMSKYNVGNKIKTVYSNTVNLFNK